MTQTLDIQPEVTEHGERASTCQELRGRDVQEAERLIEPFLCELRSMAPEERIKASRYTMKHREYWVYAAHFPDEVPLVNGELEHIALNLA